MLVRKCFVQSPRAGRNVEDGGATASTRNIDLVLREVVAQLTPIAYGHQRIVGVVADPAFDIHINACHG